jgi:ribosomal protein S18 acetylase RimI-like enzyme
VRADNDVAGRTDLVADGTDDPLGGVRRGQGELERYVLAWLRLLPGHAAEVTRVFVIPAARRRGLGSRLLDCLEGHARHHRVTTLRLDTRRDLIEARRLYARHGYREVTPFSSGPYADHWFEKTLP